MTSEITPIATYYIPCVGITTEGKIESNEKSYDSLRESSQGRAYKNGQMHSFTSQLLWDSFIIEPNRITVKNLHFSDIDVSNSTYIYKVNFIANSYRSTDIRILEGQCISGNDLVISSYGQQNDSEEIIIPEDYVVSAYVGIFHTSVSWVSYTGEIDTANEASVLHVSENDKNTIGSSNASITLDHQIQQNQDGKNEVMISEVSSEVGSMSGSMKYYCGDSSSTKTVRFTDQQTLLMNRSIIATDQQKIPITVWIQMPTVKSSANRSSTKAAAVSEKSFTVIKSVTPAKAVTSFAPAKPVTHSKQTTTMKSDTAATVWKPQEPISNARKIEVSPSVVANLPTISSASSNIPPIMSTFKRVLPISGSSDGCLKFSAIIYIRGTNLPSNKVYTLNGKNGTTLSFRGRYSRSGSEGHLTLYPLGNSQSPSYKLGNTSAQMQKFPCGSYYYYTLDNNNNMDPLKSPSCNPIPNENGGCTVKFGLDKSIQLSMWVLVNTDSKRTTMTV
jgi:hypothetical protein